MALNLSFSNNGATPNTSNSFLNNYGSSNSFLSSSPFSKALANAQSPNMSTIQGPKYAPPPTLGTNAGPVKSQTVKVGADGSVTHTVNHDTAPDPTQSGSSSYVSSNYTPPASSGLLTSWIDQTQGKSGPQQFIPLNSYAPGSPQNSGSIMTSGVAEGYTPPQDQVNSQIGSAISVNQGGVTPNGTVIGPNGQPISDGVNFSGLLGNVNSAAQGNIGIGQQAQAISDKYGKLQQGLLPQINSEAGYLTTGTTPVAEGGAAVAAQVANARSQQLNTAQQSEMAGIQPQLTAQSQEQSGLLGAAGLIPSGLRYGAGMTPASTSGATGAPTITFNPQVDAQNIAKAIMNGQMTYQQGISSLGYASDVADGLLNSAIQSQGGNPLTLQAQGQAQQTNIQTQGTTQTSIGAQGLADATKTYTDAFTYNNTAANQANVLQNVLDSSGINSSNSADWNNAINNLTGRLGNTGYSQFVTALNELQNSYSQLLSTGGGTPSQQDATALATLNPNNSAQQIMASIETLKADASAKLNSLYGNVQTYQKILNGGQLGTPSNTNAQPNKPAGWL